MHYKCQNVLGNFLIFKKLYLCHINGRLNKKLLCIFMSFLSVFDNAWNVFTYSLRSFAYTGRDLCSGSEPPLHTTAATSRQAALFKWCTVSPAWRGKWQWSDKVNHAPHRRELGGVKIMFLRLTHTLHVLSGSDCCGSPVLKHMRNFLQTATLKIK